MHLTSLCISRASPRYQPEDSVRRDEHGRSRRDLTLTSTLRGCVLVGAVDHTTNFTMLRHNIALMTNWTCVVFGSKRDAASLSGLSSRCTLLDPPKDRFQWFWGGLLLRAASVVPQNTTHVMTLLDDVDISAVSIPRIMQTFDQYPAAVVSPRIQNASFDIMYRHHPGVDVVSLDAIETYATVFSASAFDCFTKMIRLTAAKFPQRSIVGWGYDRCFSGLCNGSSYVVQTEVAQHSGKRRLWGEKMKWPGAVGGSQLRHIRRETKRLTGRECGQYKISKT